MGNKKNKVRSRKKKLLNKQRHMMEMVRRRKILLRGSFADHSDINTFNLHVTEDINKNIEKTTETPIEVNPLDQDLFKQEANEDVLKGIERDNTEFEDQSEEFIVHSEGIWANGVRNCALLNPSINTVSGKTASKKKQKTKTSVRNCRSPTAATPAVNCPLVIAPISVGNYQLVIGPITGSNKPFVTPVISLGNEPLTIAVTPIGNDALVTDNASAWSDPLSIATTLDRNNPLVTSNAFAWGDPFKNTPVGDDSLVPSNSFALNDSSKTTSIGNDFLVTSNASAWTNPLNTTPVTNNPLVPGTTLNQISSVVRHDFTRYGQSVGVQLNALPLKNALELQAKIQQMIQDTCLALGQTINQASQPGLILTKPNNELAMPDTCSVKNELCDDSDDSDKYYILGYS